MTKQLELIAGYYSHAKYLEAMGDSKQAALFRMAAQALERQLGAPPPGSARPAQAIPAEAAREAGAPAEKVPVRPEISPPESRGFTPAQLRSMIGEGRVK